MHFFIFPVLIINYNGVNNKLKIIVIMFHCVNSTFLLQLLFVFIIKLLERLVYKINQDYNSHGENNIEYTVQNT